jgi:hypothetical protein
VAVIRYNVLQLFVEEGHAVLSLFPPRYYALALPSILGSLLFGGVMTFIGAVFIRAQLQRYKTELGGVVARSGIYDLTELVIAGRAIQAWELRDLFC